MVSAEKNSQQLDALREELDRLNASFTALLKDAGINQDDLKNLDINTLPAPVKDAFNTAQTEAKRAGAARAAQNSVSSTASTPRSTRRGIVRL